MPYIQVKDVGRVYAMEPGDLVISREGAVRTRNDVVITGKCADPGRVASWERDGLIETPASESKPSKKKTAKRKAGRTE